VLRVLLALRRRPTLRPGTWEERPLVSLIVAAYDEEDAIAAKVPTPSPSTGRATAWR
jgi:hypothetical protein